MSVVTAEIRMMLKRYERQLMAYRRVVRYRVKRRLAQGQNPQDPDPSPKRRMYVDKVAKEIFESLIYTGSDNPIIEEIRSELSNFVGTQLRFFYPPGKRLRIVKVIPEGHAQLSEEERHKVRTSLWRITREKINASMLQEQKDELSCGDGGDIYADIFKA